MFKISCKAKDLFRIMYTLKKLHGNKKMEDIP